VLELSQLIGDLRSELSQAIAAGVNESVRFELGPIEIEFAVVIEESLNAGAKVRFWVVSADTAAKAAETSSQRIKLTLLPRSAETDNPPWVSGAEESNER
jgi:hypothetical protein